LLLDLDEALDLAEFLCGEVGLAPDRAFGHSIGHTGRDEARLLGGQLIASLLGKRGGTHKQW
jgi:hypothetical protein